MARRNGHLSLSLPILALCVLLVACAAGDKQTPRQEPTRSAYRVVARAHRPAPTPTPAVTPATALLAAGEPAPDTPTETSPETPRPRPSVIPSKYQLAYFGSDQNVYLVDVNGNEKSKIPGGWPCSHGASGLYLQWSPTAHMLSCSVGVKGAGTVLIDSLGQRVVTLNDVATIYWSPTGALFAYVTIGESAIVISDDSGKAVAKLGPTELRPLPIPVGRRPGVWSPDGMRIAHWIAPTMSPCCGGVSVYSVASNSDHTVVAGDYRPLAWLRGENLLVANSGAFSGSGTSILNLENGALTPLPELVVTIEQELVISADGSKIAVLTHSQEAPSLAVFDLNSRQRTLITDTVGLRDFVRRLTFSPDGSELYWTNDLWPHLKVYRANTDGTGLTVLAELPLGRIEFSSDFRSIAYIADSDGWPRDLYIADIDGANMRAIGTMDHSAIYVGHYAVWRPVP